MDGVTFRRRHKCSLFSAGCRARTLPRHARHQFGGLRPVGQSANMIDGGVLDNIICHARLQEDRAGRRQLRQRDHVGEEHRAGGVAAYGAGVELVQIL